MVGSAAAPAASCKNRRRGNFMSMPPHLRDVVPAGQGYRNMAAEWNGLNDVLAPRVRLRSDEVRQEPDAKRLSGSRLTACADVMTIPCHTDIRCIADARLVEFRWPDL